MPGGATVTASRITACSKVVRFLHVRTGISYSLGRSLVLRTSVAMIETGRPLVKAYILASCIGYASLSGTSMATPPVAGMAALAWSVSPDATVTEIRTAILAGVDPLASLDGRMVTGGRLNALGTLEQLGLHVNGSTPARQSILSGQPVDFTIDLSAPFDPASIDASDLTVNGIAADSFTLVDSDSITFHYNTSPAVSEGAQQMAIASGVISNTDGSELVRVLGKERTGDRKWLVWYILGHRPDPIRPMASCRFGT